MGTKKEKKRRGAISFAMVLVMCATLLTAPPQTAWAAAPLSAPADVGVTLDPARDYSSAVVTCSAVAGASAYLVEYQEQGRSAWQVGNIVTEQAVHGGVATIPVTGLKASSTSPSAYSSYAFRVTALGDGVSHDNSDPSASAAITMGALRAGDMQTNMGDDIDFRTLSTSPEKVTLSWSEPLEPGAYTIGIVRYDANENPVEYGETSASAATIELTLPEGDYGFRVLAAPHSTGICGSWNNFHKFKVKPTPPPSGLTASALRTDTEITLSWTPPASAGPTAAFLEYKKTSEPASAWKPVISDDRGNRGDYLSPCTATSLSAVTAYDFRLYTVGINSSAEEAFIRSDYRSISGIKTALATPKIIKALPAGIGQVKLDYTVGNFTDYCNVFCRTGNGSWMLTTTATAMTTTVTGLRAGSIYEFYVQAKNSSADYPPSAPSATVWAVTMPAGVSYQSPTGMYFQSGNRYESVPSDYQITKGGLLTGGSSTEPIKITVSTTDDVTLRNVIAVNPTDEAIRFSKPSGGAMSIMGNNYIYASNSSLIKKRL